MRRALAFSILALLAIPAAGASIVTDYTVGSAHGLVATPAGAPKALVVILHGYNHSAESHRGHLQHLADQGYLAVAMDYSGPKSGFPLAAGAADTRAAILDLRATHGLDDEPSHLYSVSMGTAVAALLLPAMPGAFTYWVNNEGLSMLQETWAGATALAPTGNPTAVAARDGIEAECAGSPAASPTCYLARSAALRAPEFVGIQGVVLTHGLNDGLVPYNQGRDMVAALRGVGVPSDFYTVVRSEPGGEGTTLTGYTPLGGQGLAGHGTESLDHHALTALSFRLLDEVLAGTLVPSNAERISDRDLGTLP